MSHYSFFVWSNRSRVKYPRTLDLPDIAAARDIALKIGRIFVDTVPRWDSLSAKQKNAFVVEIVNDIGQTVLTVPFRKIQVPAL